MKCTGWICETHVLIGEYFSVGKGQDSIVQCYTGTEMENWHQPFWKNGKWSIFCFRRQTQGHKFLRISNLKVWCMPIICKMATIFPFIYNGQYQFPISVNTWRTGDIWGHVVWNSAVRRFFAKYQPVKTRSECYSPRIEDGIYFCSSTIVTLMPNHLF